MLSIRSLARDFVAVPEGVLLLAALEAPRQGILPRSDLVGKPLGQVVNSDLQRAARVRRDGFGCKQRRRTSQIMTFIIITLEESAKCMFTSGCSTSTALKGLRASNASKAPSELDEQFRTQHNMLRVWQRAKGRERGGNGGERRGREEEGENMT